jgi:integrase
MKKVKSPNLKISVQPKLKGNKYYLFLRINFGKSDTRIKKVGEFQLGYEKRYRSLTISTGLSFVDKQDWNFEKHEFVDNSAQNLLLDNYRSLTLQVIEKNQSLLQSNNISILGSLIKKLVLGKVDTKQFDVVVNQKGVVLDKSKVGKRHLPNLLENNPPQITGEVVQVAEFVQENVEFEKNKAEVIKKPLSEFIEYTYLNWIVTKERAKNSARTYKNSSSFVARYCIDKNIKITVNNFNQKFVESFMIWIKEQKQEDGSQYGVGYISDIRKQLRKIDSELQAKYNITTGIVWINNPILKRTKEESSIDVALSTVKVKELLNYQIPKRYIDKKGIERDTPKGKYWAFDLIRIGIFTGLRISDLSCLNLVQTNDGDVYVDQILQKTGKHVRFVVPKLVCDIWEKYNRKLPKLADSNLADYFEEIGLELGWTELHYYSRKNPSVKGKKSINKSKEFYLMLKTSTLRRTFSTLALNHFKLNPLEIIKITGHSTVKQLYEYVRADETEFNDKLKAKFEAFGV